MALKHILRDRISSALGIRIMRHLPLGNDKFQDIRLLLPRARVRTILDVGANTGQSAKQFQEAYPDALLHCCEPVPATFAKLKQAVHGTSAQVHQIALGSRNETLRMHVIEDERLSDISSLKGVHPSFKGKTFRTEEVQVMPLDEFITGLNIDHIDYLKIDTEGHDLEVIKGAHGILSRQGIDLLDVEVGMNPTNTFHVPLADVMKELSGHNVHLFGVYEQLHEWGPRRPVLRRCNALFISERLADLHAGPVA